ncbi:MAG: A/G-specific adenine glycosylase [Gallionella sp.]|nr:A/G-specific adenine glycosylase [Gallionella sp.]
MHSFSSRLIRWQRQHGRHDLPWQGQDAYRVWLSEIMLQQTQVATVIPYYLRFIASFPTITALAAASEDEVLAHWSGLGYYARGRNLHKAARIVVEKFSGEFPRQLEDIVELPGIGRSTAAAICALAFHERRAILDGNVKRVLARYCAVAGWTGEKRVESALWQHAERLLPENDVATYIQGLMDMGATLCVRGKPKCPVCPVRDDCAALATGCVQTLPTPRPRKSVPGRNTVMLMLSHGNEILLEKRAPHGVWGGLWSFPQFDDAAKARAWCGQHGIEILSERRLEPFIHVFTHFKLHITPLWLTLRRKPVWAAQSDSMWHPADAPVRAAIPAPIRVLLANAGCALAGDEAAKQIG